MSIFEVVSGGASLLGGLLEYKAANAQASAYTSQAAFTLEFGEEQARTARELAEIEAALLEKQGATAQEVAAFNADIARRNAAWEQRAGELLLSQARRAGDARLSAISSALSSQGRVVEDTTSDLLLSESLAELERDLANIALSSQSRVSREQQQATLFELQGQRSGEFSRQQAAGRRRSGEIEAQGLLRSAQMSAAGANVNAQTARLSGRSSLLGTFSDLAGIFSRGS